MNARTSAWSNASRPWLSASSRRRRRAAAAPRRARHCPRTQRASAGCARTGCGNPVRTGRRDAPPPWVAALVERAVTLDLARRPSRRWRASRSCIMVEHPAGGLEADQVRRRASHAGSSLNTAYSNSCWRGLFDTLFRRRAPLGQRRPARARRAPSTARPAGAAGCGGPPRPAPACPAARAGALRTAIPRWWTSARRDPDARARYRDRAAAAAGAKCRTRSTYTFFTARVARHVQRVDEELVERRATCRPCRAARAYVSSPASTSCAAEAAGDLREAAAARSRHEVEQDDVSRTRGPSPPAPRTPAACGSARARAAFGSSRSTSTAKRVDGASCGRAPRAAPASCGQELDRARARADAVSTR